MAGGIGQGLGALGDLIIPNEMERLRRPALLEQARRQQQVGDIQGRRILGAEGAEVGTPETKRFVVPEMDANNYLTGRTKSYGADARSTVKPLFSPTKRDLLFSQQSPELARDVRSKMIAAQIIPPKPEVKAYKPGDVVGMQSVDGTFTPTFTVPSAPDVPKAGATRSFQRGGTTVTQEADGVGGWRDLAEGPTWKPDAPKEAKDTFGDEAKLRSEFDTKTKDFALTRDAYSRIVEVAANPSPAGDIALIFGFMKMNDPGSTVREGEYATAQNAGSVPQRVWAMYNKVLSGETLTPAQRADFVAQAGRLYGSQVKSFSQDYSRYSDLASKYSIDPTKIVYDRTGGLPAAMPAPQASGTAMAAQQSARPRAVNPVTGAAVEWDGNSWVESK